MVNVYFLEYLMFFFFFFFFIQSLMYLITRHSFSSQNQFNQKNGSGRDSEPDNMIETHG